MAQELGFVQVFPTIIFEDNNGLLQLAIRVILTGVPSILIFDSSFQDLGQSFNGIGLCHGLWRNYNFIFNITVKVMSLLPSEANLYLLLRLFLYGVIFSVQLLHETTAVGTCN